MPTQLHRKEQRWTSVIGQHLSVAVPQIIAVGEPNHRYSENWSIVEWLGGIRSGTRSSGQNIDRAALAIDLARVIREIRQIKVSSAATADPRLRWYRGRPLAEFDSVTRKCLSICEGLDGFNLDLDLADKIWSDAMELPEAREVKPDQWYHSDLVAENLLMVNGSLSAVLDFGGAAIGDPTIDLHGAWELFDQSDREIFRQELSVSDADWQLGRAWALGIALGAFSYYWRTMPERMQDRLAMAQGVLDF